MIALNSRVRHLYISVVFIVLATALAQAKPVRVQCSAPEYKQFDFWVGDWDVFEIGGKAPVAHVKVDRLLDGCAIHERYEDTDGLAGESFSIYDASRKLWHQTWVTNHGQLLVIEGGLEKGSMVLSGVDRADDGRQRRVRGTWTPDEHGVRETAVRSLDGGKTWRPWFDLEFRPATTH
ncbi:MAG: hypothetical protein H0X25_05595 [Acidobacteriales bacterium]|nr:hypothetical protein [Terriglobales bacterium]